MRNVGLCQKKREKSKVAGFVRGQKTDDIEKRWSDEENRAQKKQRHASEKPGQESGCLQKGGRRYTAKRVPAPAKGGIGGVGKKFKPVGKEQPA